MTLGVKNRTVNGAHGIKVEADALLKDQAQTSWDLVALPGGMPGASTLRDDQGVQAMLRKQVERGGKLAAICAAPIALARAGALAGKTATCFPGFEEQLEGAKRSSQSVVVDGGVITSRGPGTAIAFALAIVHELVGQDRANVVRKALQVDH